MKGFLKKRWHSIPVGILSAVLAVCLIGGGVAAAAGYRFWSGGAEVTVQEALTIQMDGTDNGWIPGDGYRVVPNTHMYVIDDAHPGESATVLTKVINEGYASLTASMTYTITGGTTPGRITVTSSWISGDTVPACVSGTPGELVHSIIVTVGGDCAPGDYVVTIKFSRS